jgi:replication initiator protein
VVAYRPLCRLNHVDAETVMPKDKHDLFGTSDEHTFTRIAPLSRVQKRLIRNAVVIEADDPESLLFQHTVFCQTGLPYRDPGDGVREWEREQGSVALKVQAGEAHHPETGTWVKLGLPWGSKPRLILTHLNSEALRHGSPEIEVEESLTAFVHRIRGFGPGGREIRMFKDQLGRLSASLVRLALTRGGRSFQINTQIVTAFDLWFPKDRRQRVLWPSTVRLSADYFQSLQQHAVPLDERAVAALSHSAMGLDLYAWLAQRLHRVPVRQPIFIPWSAVKAQFGPDYRRMVDFKRKFRKTLTLVLTQYRGARIELDDAGALLRTSPPPIKGRVAALPNP